MASSIAEYFPDIPIFIAFLLFGLLASLTLFPIERNLLLLGLGMALTLFSVIVFGIYSILKEREIGKIERFLSWISEKINRPVSKERVKKEIDKFSESLNAVFKERQTFVKILLLSLSVWAINLGIMYSLFLAFKVNPPNLNVTTGNDLSLIGRNDSHNSRRVRNYRCHEGCYLWVFP